MSIPGPDGVEDHTKFCLKKDGSLKFVAVSLVFITNLKLMIPIYNNFHLRYSILSSVFPIYKLYLKRFTSMKMADLCPPIETRGMKKLNQKMFIKNIDIPCLKIKVKSIRSLTDVLKKYILRLPNFKPIRAKSSEDEASYNSQDSCVEREIFLNPKAISDFNDINVDDQERLSQLGIGEASFTKSPLQLTYENWNADDIISAILPEGVETAASYSLVGHIVHLNLREHLLDYKHVIGEVLLDKIKQARTVVNKVDTIDNTFRVFNMEVLAGDADFVTEVKENGTRYKFDFSAVYWNPRLSTEHERLVNKLSPGNVLYDVFAGVGPFTIPAAKKKCEILANDLNPESFKWLQHNAKLNKVESLIKTYNKDGADFIKTDIKEHFLQHGGEIKTHIVMNLPAISVTFLHAFKQIFTADQLEHIKTLPLIHVYCFVKGVEDCKEMAQELVENELNSSISEAIDEIFLVRNVAPNKNMMRVSFHLTENMILGAKRKLDESANCNTSKKVK